MKTLKTGQLFDYTRLLFENNISHHNFAQKAIIILYRGPDQTNKRCIKVYSQCLELIGKAPKCSKWWYCSGFWPLVKQCPLSPKITACADQALGGGPAQAASLFRWNSSVLSAPPPKSVAAFALIRAPGAGIKPPPLPPPLHPNLDFPHWSNWNSKTMRSSPNHGISKAFCTHSLAV